MNPKKVFIISLNQIPSDFWSQHIDFKNAKVWHWTNPQNGINNITTVWPDLIIIDAYWPQESYDEYLSKILSLKHKIRVFCLTPLPRSFSKRIFIDERLHVSRLDQETIEMINQVTNPINKTIKFKKSA